MERRGLKRSESRLSYRTRHFERTVRLLAHGVRLTGLWGIGYRNASRSRLVHHEIVLDGLPAAFDGYRILHLTDLHIDFLPSLTGEVCRLVGGLEADLAVFTGDYHASYGQEDEALARPYAQIVSAIRARDGALAILGNHDAAGIATMMSSLGVVTLVNESVVVARDDAEICITGTDDVHHYWSRAARRALEATAGDPRLKIALVHTSELAREAASLDYALYLTGHTHGGQICLPGGYPLITMGMNRSYAAGLWRIERMVGHTSRGIGASTIPIRFNCPSEIAVLTLRRPASARRA